MLDAWIGYLVGGSELRAKLDQISYYGAILWAAKASGNPTAWSGLSPNKDRKGLGGLR